MKKTAKKIVSIVIIFAMAVLALTPEMDSIAASKVKKITLDASARELVKGQKFTLKVSAVSPNTASKAVTFKSSNTAVATVSAKGVVKAKKKGSATITATSKANKKVKAKCKITVLSYKVPTLNLVEVSGKFACGKELLQSKWKEIYPYFCKYLGEPEKISKEGVTVSWDNAIDHQDKVDYKASTNTIYLGPLPHHNNFSDANHYDYEPFVMQMMHEAGHMFNQQGDEIVNFDFGQWIWEAISIIAETEYKNDKYGEFNRRQEATLDLLNLQGRDVVNGVFYDGNKYERSIVDSSATAAVFYMSTILSTEGTTDYWRKVNAKRMEYYKTTGVASLGWDDFAVMLDEAAGSKKIDGMKPSAWLKAQAVSETNGAEGDYLLCVSERPADSWPSFIVSCWNRYTDENGVKREKPYKNAKVALSVTDPTGKKIASGSVTIPSSGTTRYDKVYSGGNFDGLGLKNYTTMKVSAKTTVNGKSLTQTTYQTYIKGNAEKDTNTTVIMLIGKGGNIKTNIKAKDFKVSGAKKTITTGISRGTVVVKGNPGKTYTIKCGGKTYKISQPKSRRVYPFIVD